MSEIGLTGFRAKGSELGAVERHEILILRVFVGEGLEHVRIVVIRVLHMLVSKECNSFQFIFCSHYSVVLFVPFVGIVSRARTLHDA